MLVEYFDQLMELELPTKMITVDNCANLSFKYGMHSGHQMRDPFDLAQH